MKEKEEAVIGEAVIAMVSEAAHKPLHQSDCLRVTLARLVGVLEGLGRIPEQSFLVQGDEALRWYEQGKLLAKGT